MTFQVELTDSMKPDTQPSHSLQAAQAWLASICEQTAALDDKSRAETAREAILSDALSVEVREPWRAPGVPEKPCEFAILLSTGGPAVRLRGTLNTHCEPDDCWLEHQDWGTPWTRLYIESYIEERALLAYASCFYFGD